MFRSGKEREGGALRRLQLTLCSDEVYSGGAMLARTRPCTGLDGVRETAKGEKERAAAAARGRNGKG